jgi:nucleotide-binding universal stress UspA family protein
MKIVVGHHDSPEGRAALDRAIELAVERQAELHLVRLVALPKNEDQAAGYERARVDAERDLERVASSYATKGIVCRAHVPNGVSRPADAILSVAGVEDADLIVIGMRRRSRVGKLVLGSTAQEILLDADCDVLSVKAPESD